MFPEGEMLPHLICSRPMFIGVVYDEAISMVARDELVAAIAGRDAQGNGGERGRMPDEFTAVIGFHPSMERVCCGLAR
jgi:hypothetical protein